MDNRIKDMVLMQNELNIDTCGDNWRSGKTNKGIVIDWKLCMLLEAAELYDSLNWKHWKDIKSKDDLENAKIEIVDIWHFLMSYAIELKDIEVAVGLLSATLTPQVTQTYGREDSIIYFIHILSDRMKSPSLVKMIDTFSNIMYNFSMGIDDLYKLYIGKNVLNKFRQLNGYNNGTYIKMWGGVEDNRVMMSMLSEVKDSTDLFNKLTTYYNGVKAGLIIKKGKQ